MATTLRPDSKGRITLGKLAQGVSGFNVKVDAQHRIILEPLVEVSAQELWLPTKPNALKQLLSQISKENLHSEVSVYSETGAESIE